MKRIASLLSVALILAMATGASAGIVYNHTIEGGSYDIVISEVLPVGAGAAGENLVAFTLSIVNMSGDPLRNPAAFDGNTPKETRPLDTDNTNWLGLPTYTGITTGPTTADYVAGTPGDYPVIVEGDPGFHQQFMVGPTGTPTIDDPDFATTIDTHFLVSTAAILTPNTGPSEEFNIGNPWLSTNEPSDENPASPFAWMVATDFGNRLFGQFTLNGGAAADFDGDGDPTTWKLAYIVTTIDETIFMNFQVGSAGAASEDIVGSFAVPEPATMSMLAFGGIAALIRRRK